MTEKDFDRNDRHPDDETQPTAAASDNEQVSETQTEHTDEPTTEPAEALDPIEVHVADDAVIETEDGPAAEAEPEVDDGPLTLPILPLRGTVVFPLTVVPLAAAQARSLRLIDDVMSGDRTVGLVMQKDAELEGAGPNDVYEIGTIATILQMMRVPDGSVRLAVQGTERMRIKEFLAEEPFLTAVIETAPESVDDSVEIQALTRNTLELFQRLV